MRQVCRRIDQSEHSIESCDFSLTNQRPAGELSFLHFYRPRQKLHQTPLTWSKMHIFCSSHVSLMTFCVCSRGAMAINQSEHSILSNDSGLTNQSPVWWILVVCLDIDRCLVTFGWVFMLSDSRDQLTGCCLQTETNYLLELHLNDPLLLQMSR